MAPNLIARSTWLFELRLQSAVVIFVRLQISQFGSLGRCVNRLCFPFALSEGRGCRRGVSGGSAVTTRWCWSCVHQKFREFHWHSGKSCNRSLDACVASRSLGANFLVFSAESEMLVSPHKPRTTTGTKLSHLQSTLFVMINKTWSSFHSFARGDTAGVSSRSWTVTNMSKSCT